MVAQTKLVNIHLPEELYQALLAYQEQQELEEASSAIVDILAQFFHEGVPVKRYATQEQLETLESKVTRLSEQVKQLSQSMTRVAPTQEATTASTVGNEHIPRHHPAQLPVSAFASANFEEVEDEPYEILYDFLEPER